MACQVHCRTVISLKRFKPIIFKLPNNYTYAGSFLPNDQCLTIMAQKEFVIQCGELGHLAGSVAQNLESVSMCRTNEQTIFQAHSHQKRNKHTWRRLQVPPEFSVLQDHCIIPRLYMELFAVVCIETSHYVTFVKCGTGPEAPWCFFDSMADRKGVFSLF